MRHPRVAVITVLALLIGSCQWAEPRIVSPAPTESEPLPDCPSSEAVQAVTGFPKEVLEGELVKAELDRLAGTWVTIQQEIPDLRPFIDPQELPQVRQIVFDGDTCRFITTTPARGEPVKEVTYTFALDASCNPKALDLVYPPGTILAKCRYSVTDGVLTIAMGVERNQRPKGFRPSEDGVLALVLILKRKSA
jgi:uncharacterized protein (TIGR03067 family)